MDCREMIVSEDFFSVILDFRLPQQYFPSQGEDFCYQPIDAARGVYYIRRNEESPLFYAQYLYRYIPQLYGLESFPGAGGREFDPQPLEVSGILTQQRGPLSLTGRGVIIAVIDTGISYESPVFRYSDGSSRILAIWDQADQSGEPPEGFAYGTLYTQRQINEALEGESPLSVVPTRDEIGHGSALASVAAGSALEEGIFFTGAAPDVQLVVVKLKEAKQSLRDYYLVSEGVPAYAADDLMFGVKFAQQFAVPFLQPVVIVTGLGSSLGGHSGTSIPSEYLQSVAQQLSCALAVGGGNEGNAAGHFRAALIQEPTWAELRVGENVRGFVAELWGTEPARFRISIRSPGGEVIPEADFRVNREVDYTFVYEKTRVRISFRRFERNEREAPVVIRVEAPTPGVWGISVRGVTGQPDTNFDIWLLMRQFIDGEVAFLTPTPEVTLTQPAYVADAVTVSGYDSRNGSFYYNSGQGFSRQQRLIKPDLCAPAVSVSTLRGPYTGSAMAAAITAGACAQLFQWAVVEKNAPFTAGAQIRDYLKNGAAKSASIAYPSRQWGFGRLDMTGTFDVIAGRAEGS